MKLKVRLFARARDLAGDEFVTVEVSAAATVDELKQALAVQYPALQPLAPTLLVAVGTDYADNTRPLDEDMQIACFPPVSGG